MPFTSYSTDFYNTVFFWNQQQWYARLYCIFKQKTKAVTKVFSTGLVISFQTLEMSCLWWTGSSQCFFVKIPNEKKISSPHYLKISSKLSKHGLSYSLKRDPRSISKITFCANSSVNPIDTQFYFFFKDLHYLCKIKRLFIKSIQLQHDLMQAKKLQILITNIIFLNSQSSVSIGLTLKLA